MKTLRFIRLEGCGNNFIVVEDLQRAFCAAAADLGRTAAHLQNPHFGTSSDGLLIITSSREADYEVLMFNPDGSRMGMCGNGIRCVTRFLFLENLIPKHTAELQFVVEGRRIACFPADEGRMVRVDMGAPSFASADIPISNPAPEFIEQPIPDFPYLATCVSMGNPHCVIFTEHPEKVPLESVGPQLERHPIFPRRANIEFARCVSRERCQVRVWERGVGFTFACGTGACAVFAAGYRTGRLERRAVIELPGGVLEVEYRADSPHVFLTGPAREIASGEFYPEFLARAL